MRLNVRRFFQATGVLLIVFAAGLMAHGVHEFQEAGLLPVFIGHVWDINHLLDEKSTLGSVLKSLFGYNGNPSLMEVLSYVGYYAVIGLATWWRSQQWEQLRSVRMYDDGAPLPLS